MIARIAVVIPAANEEQRIATCLTAVLAAASACDCPVSVIVVLDGCTDTTAARVAAYPSVTTVATTNRNVGRARAAGTDVALASHNDHDALWLANTDADSQVPGNWLAHMLTLAQTSDLVLGTVLPEPGLDPAIEQAWFDRHQLTTGHPHIHAANLGIRASTYLAVHGWSPLAAGEDEDLAARVDLAGFRTHRTAAIPVRTSTRPVGRTPRGFSSYLRELGHAEPRSTMILPSERLP